MGLKRMVLLIGLVICGFGVAAGEELRGTLLGVHDGDTITLLTRDRKIVKVRLLNIDAPELSQPWGINSRENLRALVDIKGTLVVQCEGRDKYKRTLGQVILPDGSNANKIQVLSGNAWVYRKYCKDPLWCRMEDFARSHELGIWSTSNPTPPWEFRHRRKRQWKK